MKCSTKSVEPTEVLHFLDWSLYHFMFFSNICNVWLIVLENPRRSIFCLDDQSLSNIHQPHCLGKFWWLQNWIWVKLEQKIAEHRIKMIQHTGFWALEYFQYCHKVRCYSWQISFLFFISQAPFVQGCLTEQSKCKIFVLLIESTLFGFCDSVDCFSLRAGKQLL